MGYIDSNLLRGEKIVSRATVHWWAWGKGLIWILLGVLTSFGPSGVGIAAFFYLVGLVMVIRGVILVVTTELAITDRRVIAKFGLIRRDTVELLHRKVEGLNVSQSIFGRLMGFGTIMVNGTGSGRTPIPHIAKPLEFRKQALELIEGSEEPVLQRS